MKKNWLMLLLVTTFGLLLPLAAARPAFAGSCPDATSVVGNAYVLASGSDLNTNLIVLGNTATVEAGATVHCTVVVFGGNVDIAGTVDEDLVVFGGDTRLRSTAVINGQLVTFGGDTTRDEGALVRGGESHGFDFRNRNWSVFAPGVPFLNPVISFYRSVFQAIAVSVGLGLLALLVVLFWPEQTARVGAAVTTAPAPSVGLGLLTAIAVPVLSVVLAVTLCLIPLAFVAWIAFAAALVFGWIGLGMVVGARLSAALKLYTLSPAVSAALGTGVLTLAMYAIVWIPCAGWVAVIGLALAGLGAVLLTRFGTRPFLGGLPPAPVAPTPPAPPEPPAPPISPGPGELPAPS